MKNSRFVVPVLLAVLLFACADRLEHAPPYNTARIPGLYDRHTLLPNGWRLQPAGTHVDVGGLPLNLLITRDSRYAFTTNSGAGEASISLVELNTMKETKRQKLPDAWRGIEMRESGTALFVSGGNSNSVYEFQFLDGNMELEDSLCLELPKGKKASLAGLDIYEKKNKLLVVSKETNMLYVFDINAHQLETYLEFEHPLYDVLIDDAEQYAYVSVWGGSKVVQVELENFTKTAEFPTGPHPCEMLINPNGDVLYVTNANDNTTSVISLETNTVIEKIVSSIVPDAPPGSTPNSLAYNEEKQRLYIANADNNFVAVFDMSERRESRCLGYIPVGWYPTAVRMVPGTNKILVANGKGLTSLPNPKGANPYLGKRAKQYIGTLFKGTLSLIDEPDEEELDSLSAIVVRNTPYMDRENDLGNHQSVIPVAHSGKRSEKIEHVFYIIKENRTYDQVYGDMPQGNGDSTLNIFGWKYTPNQHSLAEQYVLFDNFFCNAEVSADGHNWSTAAYATDFVEKTWPTLYGGRGGDYDFEGGVPAARPASGYIWDLVIDAGLRYRNYGEFVHYDKERGRYVGSDEYLTPYTCPDYPGYTLSISDIERIERWKADFDSLLAVGKVPHLSMIRLGNNHTAGTWEGQLTPGAFVAQNDLATGKFIEYLSQSPVWSKSAVFIVEDDAQNGSDHIDAHRSCLLFISPFTKRGVVDHTMYTSAGVLKTIELILGLPAMTQYDLAAVPLLAPLTDEADTTAFTAQQPRTDLTEKNVAGAYGAERCAEFNLAVEDAIPDIEFNEIIWKAMRGADSPMPPPVRSAFVRVMPDDDD